jgi:hypothetical protein
MILGVAELGEGCHTIRSNGLGCQETNLKIGLAGRSGSPDEGAVVASSGGQQSSLEKEPFQHREWIGHTGT